MRNSVRYTVICGALACGASCVSPERYDDTVTALEHYQRSYHDAEQHIAELEAENERLKDQLDMSAEGVPAEASAYISDIDRRISDLDDLLGGLGRAEGDVTVRAVEGGLAYDVRDSVLFDSGSADVRPAGAELLGSLAQEIAKNPYDKIWIRGHTDSDPVSRAETRKRFPGGNLQLSAERALGVAALLVGDGKLSERKIGIMGLGPNEPLVPNDSPSNKQLNRRVEIVVLGG